jgi:hypothetical protein
VWFLLPAGAVLFGPLPATADNSNSTSVTTTESLPACTPLQCGFGMSPCKNGGTCSCDPASGLKCDCPSLYDDEDFYDPYCQLKGTSVVDEFL